MGGGKCDLYQTTLEQIWRVYVSLRGPVADLGGIKKKKSINPRLAVSFSSSDPCANPPSSELVVRSR